MWERLLYYRRVPSSTNLHPKSPQKKIPLPLPQCLALPWLTQPTSKSLPKTKRPTPSPRVRLLVQNPSQACSPPSKKNALPLCLQKKLAFCLFFTNPRHPTKILSKPLSGKKEPSCAFGLICALHGNEMPCKHPIS